MIHLQTCRHPLDGYPIIIHFKQALFLPEIAFSLTEGSLGELKCIGSTLARIGTLGLSTNVAFERSAGVADNCFHSHLPA